MSAIRIISWNVNGLRAAARKGFSDWLESDSPDVVGLQEVRAHQEQVPPESGSPAQYCTHYFPAVKRGYSGVALFSRRSPQEIETSLGEERFDEEGRFQLARIDGLWVANVYFPNGNGKNRDNSRIPYKLDFYRAVFDRLEDLRRTEAVIVMGDFNTAHEDIDIARPKDNKNNSGFRAEEREELDRWLRSGWTDSFRAMHPETVRYSWWSQRKGVRERNIGWRIDYALL
ncbi:MAG: exodeoxyribonuclease III, partial [Myxococcota bacterium]